MNTRTLLVRALLATVLVVGLVFPAFAAGEREAAETYTIRFGLANEPSHYHSLAAERFAELVEEKTDGAVTVEVFPAQQLGSETEMFSLTEEGNIQMFLASPGNVGNFVQEYQIMLTPYIWRDYEHIRKTMEGEIGQELAQKVMDAHGIRILDSLWINGARHLTTANTPVNRPADLEGVRIRASTSPIYVAAVEILGGNPVPIDFAELYMALQQGVVEGEENALGTIDARKFYEVQNYIILTGHIYQSQILGTNDEFFQSLPDDYQEAIEEAAVEARNYNNQLEEEAAERAAQKFLDLGLTIIEPDIAAFRANAEGVGERLQDLWGDPTLYDRIQRVR